MIKKILTLLAFIFIGVGHAFANSGIALSGTRLIYNSDANQTSINVINTDSKPFLIQSWVTATPKSNAKEDSLFITTPPLFRLEGDSTNSVRVVYVGNSLPQDRESVYWLNIKAIPSADKKDSNQLIIAVKSQIKLFYRPMGLPGNSLEAYQHIKFTEKSGKLVINNPTAYYVSFNKINVNGSNLKEAIMAAPFSEQTVNIKATVGQTITWNAISDYGANLPDISAKITK